MANREYTIKLDIAFHPGEMLEEKLQEMAMPVNSFAEQSKVPESIVRDIIHGDASISSDIAIAFEEVTKIPARLWINMQHAYDDYILAKQRPSYLTRIARLAQRAAI